VPGCPPLMPPKSFDTKDAKDMKAHFKDHSGLRPWQSGIPVSHQVPVFNSGHPFVSFVSFVSRLYLNS
jgi:hypothetical protein